MTRCEAIPWVGALVAVVAVCIPYIPIGVCRTTYTCHVYSLSVFSSESVYW